MPKNGHNGAKRSRQRKQYTPHHTITQQLISKSKGFLKSPTGIKTSISLLQRGKKTRLNARIWRAASERRLEWNAKSKQLILHGFNSVERTYLWSWQESSHFSRGLIQGQSSLRGRQNVPGLQRSRCQHSEEEKKRHFPFLSGSAYQKGWGSCSRGSTWYWGAATQTPYSWVPGDHPLSTS